MSKLSNYINDQSEVGRGNIKFKIIIFLGAILLISGCVNKVNNSYKLKNNISQSSPQVVLPEEPKKEARVLFVGDTMFDRYIRAAAEKHGGDYNYPLSQIRDYLKQFDLVAANLEGPITGNESRSVNTNMDEKSNLVFTFDPKSAGALAENNIKLVSLGNNHILNQGESGLAETKKYLDGAGVAYFGDIGRTESSTLRAKVGGIKIGFVSYNYSVAGSAERAIADIENMKKQADLTVVCPHWGTEYKVGDAGNAIHVLAHQFIDAGANVIIGTHPHVIENEEDYKNKKIYYSLGNFLFDQYFQKETEEGLGVILTIEPDLAMKYDTVKFKMAKSGQTVLDKSYIK
jgi:poly-gamma-glutamate capsule biosynthesis protein CapA/YwtB (metallophosphatase superfamily)